MHNTIYPHPYQIQKISPFPADNNSDGKGAVAGVLLRYGPVSIRAKLVQSEKGLFLSMPRRKIESSGDYINVAFITDRTLLETLEALAISEYHKTMLGAPAELVAA